MNALERVESALLAAGCTQRSGNWSCPSHQDREPSLHVTSDSRGVAMRCFAGCDTTDIVSTLGMTMDELFEEPFREVERYDYWRDGKLYEKVRLTNGARKTFRWEPALNGHRMGLYRIEEALELPEPLYLVESERDVNTLLSKGVSATCMPGGAGDWRGEYTSALSGREVVIVADRDDAGIKHAMKVKGEIPSARVVQSRTPGEHHDIGDHLAAGFQLAELLPFVMPNRVFTPVSLVRLYKEGVPPPVLLCRDLLYEGGLHSIAGPPDCGKTTIALWWAMQLLREGRKVLFLDEEGGQEIVVERLVSLGITLDELENLIYLPFPGRQWTDGDILALLEIAAGVSMMLVDSSAAFMARAGLDENLARDVTGFWSRVLTPVARQAKAAVVVIDHVKKESEPGTRYARGSGGKLAALDVQVMIEMLRPFSREQDGMLKYTVSKDRRGWLHRYWKVRIHTDHGSIVPQFAEDDLSEPGEGSIPGPPARRKIYEVLNDTPAGYRQIVDAVNARYGHFLSRQTVSTELNELGRAGYAESIDQGRETLWTKCR